MKWLSTALAACALVSPLGFITTARSQTPDELARTASLVAASQNPDGGFASRPGGPSSLGATSSSVKVLKYTGGAIPDVLACLAYVRACFQPDSGGFAPAPGGKPDVATTASGLMAMGELKLADAPLIEGAVRYLASQAKTYEEVRIALAGLEAVRATSPEFPRWETIIRAGEKPDGTFGEGVTLARETGGRAAALLRMGKTLEHRDAIVAALKGAQTPAGGWAKSDAGPDLEASYRIVRALYMLREAPDLDRLRAFVARCRHEDGSYGTQPGDAGSGGTYMASILLYWSRLLGGEPGFPETAGFTPLSNGKDLTGWEGATNLWAARDGVLVGTSPGLDHNEFLAHTGTFGSAILKLTFRIDKGEGNSGVQFRSVRVPGHEMSGYQADLGENFWGCLYDESRRNKVLVPAAPEALKTLNKGGWNEYVIDARGPEIRLALNGVTSVRYREDDPAIAREGRIAVQIHAGGPMVANFKDILVQPLPEPADNSGPEPGWQLRTLKGELGGRKYALFIPKGFRRETPSPVVLFLHGAGARGDDGLKPVQAGLGPALLKNPEAFPFVAVFPQALKTWADGSPDAIAALATLDEVSRDLKTDPRRVYLTGLSMGGAGAWQMAAAHPERFAAVVPICGRAASDRTEALAKVPVWAFVGDADRDETVLDNRALIAKLRAANGGAHYTEYRGVGHNSWDRAYNDPALARWLLAQARP